MASEVILRIETIFDPYMTDEYSPYGDDEDLPVWENTEDQRSRLFRGDSAGVRVTLTVSGKPAIELKFEEGTTGYNKAQGVYALIKRLYPKAYFLIENSVEAWYSPY